MGAAQQFGQVATRVLFENDDIKVWEMDLQPGETCGLHHHTMDYVLYIIEGSHVAAQPLDGKPYAFDVKARTTLYIPHGGKESAHNNGPARFHEALFELKRPLRPGRAAPGYSATEALAGKAPEPGVLTILDNDRVRVREITLAPGDSTGMRRRSHDTAVFVVEGGTLSVAQEHAPPAEVVHQPDTVTWKTRGASQTMVNTGATRYREVSVELK